MSAHTPGPWYAIKMRGWGGSLCISTTPQDKADQTIGDCPIAVVQNGSPHWETKYPVEANATLIARAPDLLAENTRLTARVAKLEAALRDALVVIEEFGDLNGFRNLTNEELGRLVISASENARAALTPEAE